MGPPPLKFLAPHEYPRPNSLYNRLVRPILAGRFAALICNVACVLAATYGSILHIKAGSHTYRFSPRRTVCLGIFTTFQGKLPQEPALIGTFFTF